MPEMHVVFGASPDQYFMSYGIRYVAEKMPDAFMEKVKSGELNVNRVGYISMDRQCKNWVAHNRSSGNVYFTLGMNEVIVDHFRGANGKSKSTYANFPEDEGGYFIKFNARGGWNAQLENVYIESIAAMRTNFKDFDLGLTNIVFGKGGLHIFCFEAGFYAQLTGEAENSEHVLHMSLMEFSDGSWTLEQGSKVSMYDPQYFFLKFQKRGTVQVNYRWHFPPEMEEKWAPMRAQTETLEDQRAIQADNQMQMMIMNQQTAMTNMFAQTMIRGSENVAAAAGAYTYRSVYR